MNYFELFEMPISLYVAADELEKKYSILRAKYNTNLAPVDENEHDLISQKTTYLEKAYETLKDPIKIMQYVLSLKGLFQKEEKYELPASFLIEVKDLDESLSDADILDIEETETKIFQLQKILYDEVQTIVEDYDDYRTTDAQLLEVKEYYYKKKYLQRILDRLDGMRNIAG